MKIKASYKRILIVEVNWLGDVLFSTPLIRAVREKFKDAYIACMVVPRCREILEYNPRIDEIIVYDEKGEHRGIWGKLRFILSLRKKRFDLAILLHRSFTRTFLTRLSGIKNRAGYATEKRRVLLTHPVEPLDAPLHKVEYFLKIAESLGCDASFKNYEFFISDREKKHIEEELSKSGIKKEDLLVVINPGGNWLPKRWPEENFAKLADFLVAKYGAKVVISGGKPDMEIAIRIKKGMREVPAIFAGKTNLKELAALMERADFVISGDSGPMHIAVARGASVIALFGPTSPRLTGPYGNGNYRIIQKDVGCEVPCYDLTCGNYRCMKAITVDDVTRVFDKIYKNAKNRQIQDKTHISDNVI
ncbi:MAG: lipopolysaccharide heptosyltransferase II [Candidatus Omnitrophota bacterium]|nr:MAG: lipopolysaccharide heptosyltransferase II [Candidatus Omnitrophota bacterium]